MIHQVVPPQPSQTLEGWVESHYHALRDAYAKVKRQTERRQAWDQVRYNRTSHALPLLPGERVLVRNFHRCAQGKLSPRWGPQQFVVLARPNPEQPVYVVQPEAKEGPVHTIHRNNLRLCLSDPTNASSPENVEKPVQDRSLGCVLGAHPPVANMADFTPMTWNQVPIGCEVAPATESDVVRIAPCPVNSELTVNLSDPNSFSTYRAPDQNHSGSVCNADFDPTGPAHSQMTADGNVNALEPDQPVSVADNVNIPEQHVSGGHLVGGLEPEEDNGATTAGPREVSACPRRLQRSNFGMRPLRFRQL